MRERLEYGIELVNGMISRGGRYYSPAPDGRYFALRPRPHEEGARFEKGDLLNLKHPLAAVRRRALAAVKHPCRR